MELNLKALDKKVQFLFDLVSVKPKFPSEKNFIITRLDINKMILFSQTKHQDKVLKQATREIVRLNRVLLDGVESRKSRNEATLFVGNLSPEINRNEMRIYFEKFFPVHDAFIVNRHKTSQCGFVEFEKKEDALKLLGFGPFIMGERLIRVEKSRGRKIFSGKENSKPAGTISPTSSRSSRRNNRFSPY